MEQKTTTTPPMGGGHAEMAEGRHRTPLGNLCGN